MYIAVSILGALLLLGFIYEQAGRRSDRKLPLPGRIVAAGGYRLHVVERGTIGPTVVILHGAGESSYSWVHVQQQVAKFARVIAFDRPGIGSSGPGPALSVATAVDELHALLSTLGAPGPHVLVGHSIGGLIARMYALHYPAEVGGIVFVDSSHEFLKDDAKFRQSFNMIGGMLKFIRFTQPVGLLRFMVRVLGVMPMYPERASFLKQITPDERRQWEAAFFRNVTGTAGMQELTEAIPMLEEGARERHTSVIAPQYGNLPFAVLTNPGFGASWIEMHKELAARSTNSLHWVSDKPGHNVHMQRPDLVVGAIRHVADQLMPVTPRESR